MPCRAFYLFRHHISGGPREIRTHGELQKAFVILWLWCREYSVLRKVSIFAIAWHRVWL
jgi:hypothetical protein